MRYSELKRKTNETDITLSIELDGCGKASIRSGNGFFDHMLTLLAVHGRFDITLDCKGDTEVDFHHSAEDIGIALGKAFAEALGEKRGITRYGSVILPMDEALVLAALDLSGRAHLTFDAEFPSRRVGSYDTELTEEFFAAFVREAKITLHIKKLDGKNTHHTTEAIFKAAARALRTAVKLDPELSGEVPSSKGVLV